MTCRCIDIPLHMHTPLHMPEVDKASAPSHATNHFWLFFYKADFSEQNHIFIIAYYQNVMISIQNILAGEFKSSQWTNHVAVISRCQFRSEICFGRNQDILFFEATRLLTYGRKSSSTERVNILTSVFLPNCRHFWIQLVCWTCIQFADKNALGSAFKY